MRHRRLHAARPKSDLSISQSDQELRETEKRFRIVFESGGMGIVLFDPKSRQILKCNPAFQEMLGYSESEIRKLGVDGITHPGDRDLSHSQIEELRSGTTRKIEFEKRYIRKDGTVIWGHVITSFGESEGRLPPFVVTLVEDITEIKRAREEIEALLAREKAARIDAQAAVSLRDDFVSANHGFKPGQKARNSARHRQTDVALSNPANLIC